MKDTIFIFGCGSAGQRAWEALGPRAQVAGFIDNNSALHGTQLHSRPVYAPAALPGLDYDGIVIASMYHRQIRTQLVEQLGVDPRRIRLAPEFAATEPRRFTRRALIERFRQAGWPTDANDFRLWRLRNRHRGRRGFIIGNGPSLQMEDLERLRARGEICLASNKIFLAFARTAWRPTYFGLEDKDIARRSFAEIDGQVRCPNLVANYLGEYLPPAAHRTYFRLLPRVVPPHRPGFSRNLLAGIHCGGTITYTLLQLAAWLGLSEVYLLGVDFSYNLGPLKEHRDFKGFKEYTSRPEEQKNYFAPDYFRPGEYNVAPDLAASLCAYESARALCHERGTMRIRNATRGGQLEVFDRVDFDQLVD